MISEPERLRERTKKFAVSVVQLFRALRRNDEARVMGKQLLRSGTGVAANYRAVCRARSRAEFISKIGIVVEETDETVFWLELLVEIQVLEPAKVQSLLSEAKELVAIFAASQRTARSHEGLFSSCKNCRHVN